MAGPPIFTEVAIDALNTSGKAHYITANPGGLSRTTSVTNYFSVAGFTGFTASESITQIQAQVAFTASNMETFVSANTISATSTINFRIGGGNGNQTIPITASTTGYFEDTTHNDSISTSSLINYQIVTGGTGTSISLSNIGILANFASSPPVVFNDPIWFGMTF